MEVMLEGVSVDRDHGAVTVAMSPQEVNRIANALWQLMHDAPAEIEFGSIVGVAPDRVYALANELGEVSTITPTQHDEP